MTYFNEKFKEEFLDYILRTSTKSVWSSCKTILKHSSVIEHQLNKDLYDFDTEELITLFEKAGWITRSYYDTSKTNLKKYFMYAISRNKIPEKDIIKFARVKFDVIKGGEKISSMFYKDYNSFLSAFNSIFEEHCEYLDYFVTERIKCIMSLAWFGACKADIFLIDKTDINTENNTIFLPAANKYITVPKDVIQLCIKLSEKEYYENYMGNITTFAKSDKVIKIREVINNIDDNDMVLKNLIANFKTDFLPSIIQINGSVKAFLSTLKYERIEKNGRFEKAYNYEKRYSRFINSSEYAKLFQIVAASTARTEFSTYSKWKKEFCEE